MRKVISFLLVTALIAVSLPFSLTLSEETVADEPHYTVIASFYPIYIFAENILQGIDGISLYCLSAPTTGCLHDYQLLVGDMEKLSEADAFLICGAGMEGYLDQALQQFPELYTVDSSVGIELIEETHEHHHEHSHHENDDHEGDSDEHDEEKNAHMWLDPLRAAAMVENLADGLIRRFPEYESEIRANVDIYVTKLTELDREIETSLSGLTARDIVTFHEAFPYFAERYGLNIVAVMALEPEEPLSPAEMIELAEEITEHGCPPLFTEPQYSSKAASVLSRETGAKVFELDPIVTGDYSADSYEKGMRKNMLVLIEALSNSAN